MNFTGKSQFDVPTRAVQTMRTPLLKAASSIQVAIDEMYPALNLHMDLPKKEASPLLNGRLIPDGLEGMLVLTDWPVLHVVFAFVVTLLDMCIWMSDRPMLPSVHTFYSDLWTNVYVGAGR